MNIANLLINPIISSNEEASFSSSPNCQSQSKSLLSCLSTKAFFTRTQQQQYCILYGNVRDLKPRDVTVTIFEYMLWGGFVWRSVVRSLICGRFVLLMRFGVMCKWWVWVWEWVWDCLKWELEGYESGCIWEGWLKRTDLDYCNFTHASWLVGL